MTPLAPKLHAVAGMLLVETRPHVLVYVDQLERFLERTPEEKTRLVKLAVARVQQPSKTIH